MSIDVLIISHGNIASAMLQAVKNTLGRPLPLNVSYLQLKDPMQPMHLDQQLQQAINSLNPEQGTLILVDVLGATPCNIAKKLMHFHNIRIITGLNFPMLLRIMSYPELDLDALAAKAVDGATNGIQLLSEPDHAD